MATAMSHIYPGLIGKDDKIPRDPKKDQAAAYCQEGDRWLDQGNNDMAIGFYKKAVEVCPDEPFFYSELGTAYQNKGDLQSAVASFKKSILLKPDYYPYLALDTISWERKMYEEAIPNLVQAGMRWDTGMTDSPVFQLMGHCYFQTKRFPQAQSAFTKAYQINPRDPVNVYFLAASNDALNDKSEALRLYNQFLMMRCPDNNMNATAQRRIQALTKK